jgi:hypothetical protein
MEDEIVTDKIFRTFYITTGPNIADPSWAVACGEIVEGVKNQVMYSDFSVIKGLIAKWEIHKIETEASSKELTRILNLFGFEKFDDYPKFLALAKSHKESK